MRKLLFVLGLLLLAATTAYAQTSITGRIAEQPSAPAACGKGDFYANTSTGIIYGCKAPNVWSQIVFLDGAQAWTALQSLSSNYNINVTPVTVAANVTTDQNLMAYTVPAGTLNSVGRTLKVHASGVYSTPVASVATVTEKLKLCTVSGCGSGVVLTLVNITSTANPGTVTNNPLKLDASSSTQTAGATASFEADGFMTIDLGALSTAADSVFSDTNTATIGTIDSTAQLFLQYTVAFSAASASNSVTQRKMIVEITN